ncbi:MAG: zinc dependent phospholipase C family protein [Bacillota bacterium]
MKKLEARTHILLGKELYKYFLEENIKLSKFWLALGSIKPDFTNDEINHYKDESIKLFFEKFSKLHNLDPKKNKNKFSLKLGELYHYVADFFCYAHNNKYMKENYSKHFKYELSLNSYAYKKRKNLFKNSKNNYYIYNLSLKELLNLKHKKYLKEKKSFATDLKFAFEFNKLLTKKLFFNINYEDKEINSRLNIAK